MEENKLMSMFSVQFFFFFFFGQGVKSLLFKPQVQNSVIFTVICFKVKEKLLEEVICGFVRLLDSC